MNKYVVAFVTLHENEIEMYEVEADNDLDAAVWFCVNKTGWTDLEDYVDLETLKNDLFDGDCLINVIKIS